MLDLMGEQNTCQPGRENRDLQVAKGKSRFYVRYLSKDKCHSKSGQPLLWQKVIRILN